MKSLIVTITLSLLTMTGTSFAKGDKIHPNLMRNLVASEFIKREYLQKIKEIELVKTKKAGRDIMTELVLSRSTIHLLSAYGCNHVEPKYTKVRDCILKNKTTDEKLKPYLHSIKIALGELISKGAIKIIDKKKEAP